MTEPSKDFSIGGNVWPVTSKLIEEMGEVQQLLGKLIGCHGREEHYSGIDLRDALQCELGDMLAAAKTFIEINKLDMHFICERGKTKETLFKKWHEEGN